MPSVKDRRIESYFMFSNLARVEKVLVEMGFSLYKIFFLLTVVTLSFFCPLKHYVFSASFISLCGILAWS